MQRTARTIESRTRTQRTDYNGLQNARITEPALNEPYAMPLISAQCVFEGILSSHSPSSHLKGKTRTFGE
jgi:hypothetical protein